MAFFKSFNKREYDKMIASKFNVFQIDTLRL